MTEQESSRVKSRRRLDTNELGWTVVGTLLVLVGLFFAATVLLTMNPTGIPLGVLFGLAGVALIVVVFRSKRS